MKTKILIAIVSLALSVTIIGCKTAQERYIDKLETIVEKAESHGDSYSEHDWEIAVKRFENTLEKIEASDQKLTSEQLKEIGRLTGRMSKVAAKHYVGEFSNIINDKAEELSGFLEGLSEDLEDVEDEIDDFMDNLEDLFSR